jgi:hypothetical protein
VRRVENVDPGANESISSRFSGSRNAETTETSFKLRPDSILQALVGAVEVVNDMSSSDIARVYTLDFARATSK